MHESSWAIDVRVVCPEDVVDPSGERNLDPLSANNHPRTSEARLDDSGLVLDAVFSFVGKESGT